MNSTLSVNIPPLPLQSSSTTRILRSTHGIFAEKTLQKYFVIKASSSSNSTQSNPPNALIPPLKAAACAVIFAAAAFGKFPNLPARAEIPTPSETLTDLAEIPTPLETLTEDLGSKDVQQEEEKPKNSPLTEFLESNSESIDALKTLLQDKIVSGEVDESLSIVRQLSSAQPDNLEWKFLIARILNELGKIEEARNAFEDILAKNPLSFEALFENTVLLDRAGEREAAMQRLEDALRVAENEMKVKEARDVKLIMAQMQFLHKNVDEALRSYEELEKEDPSDFRPYFCKGMIYSLMDKNVEAKQQFAKYRELSPKKFEVEGYLRTPLSRMKLFGKEQEN